MITTVNNKRNNYVDGQFVDIDDFQTEQNYFLDKTREIADRLGNSGVADLRGLQVIPDPVMSEPIPFPAVAVAIPPSPDINSPNPQNYTTFPLFANNSSTSLYTVFKTLTKNIQRLDLRVTLDQAVTTEVLDLIVRVRILVDPTNPLSPLANVAPLAEIQLEQPQIPIADSDASLQLDFSNENSGQGIAILANSYYAISLEFRRPITSASKIRIFHNPLNTTASVDSKHYTWVLGSNGQYAQGFNNSSGIFQNLQIYHKVFTTAVQVTPGGAQIGGSQITVTEGQFRFIEIADRRNVTPQGGLVANYVVLRYAELATDPQLIPSTRNTADSRIKDSATVSALTQPQWNTLIADPAQVNTYLLLAVVNDSNIVSIFTEQTFTIPSNSTNLAFHDWLNPSNISPSPEATTLQTARPSDFIFFVANVPAQVPLTDSNGVIQRQPTTVRDEFGNIVVQAGSPILDSIVRVTVNISFDNGMNTRTLELAVTSEVGVNRQFRNYAATISDLTDNPFDNVFTFNYGTDQISPNVVYNFVAFTTRGLPVYIQDYNAVIKTSASTGVAEPTRTDTFTVFLDQNSKTAIINVDLQLGAFNPASDTPQPAVVQYVPTFISAEIPTPVGVAPTELVSQRTDTLVSEGSFIFKPVPMARADLVTKIPNIDTAVQTAYDAADLTIYVDNADDKGPIDITFSGSFNRDKGGGGSAVLVSGAIDPATTLSPDVTWQVKIRNTDGKDNTNYSVSPTPYGPAPVGGPSNIRNFNVLCRGFNNLVPPYSAAGFQEGETAYVWINDRQALDNNNNPVTFIFSSATTTINLSAEIKALGPQQYFREKSILSIQSTTTATPGTVLIDTGLDAFAQGKASGQLIFNIAEIPTAINPHATVTLKYYGVQTIQGDIAYYKTKFTPIGTRDGFKISNINVVSNPSEFISVPEAFALTANVNQQGIVPSIFQTAAIFVDGINITSLLSPIGQKSIIADDGTALLSGQVAFNPDLGQIKFFKQRDLLGNIVSEAPSDFTRITIAYFRLDTMFVFNTASGSSYDPNFDLNSDGRIDETDLAIFTRSYGTDIGNPNYLAAADFNQDGHVDSVDLGLFQNHFGTIAIGQPNYADATSARLGSLLVVQQSNFLNRINVVKAVSRAPDAIAPTGRTILFFDDSTPVLQAGNYTIMFGFQALLSLGYAQTVLPVQTERALLGKFNLNNIKMFETNSPTTRRQITSVNIGTIANTNNLFDNTLFFTPAISTTSTWTIQALWDPEGIAIFGRNELVIPQKYELLDRTVYGPFKLQYSLNDFRDDGTTIAFTLKATDATMADGSPDSTGTHIKGIPLSQLTFTVHLTVPNGDGTTTLWTWHQLQPLGVDNKIALNYNQHLFIDHRTQGRANADVLTPFGLAAAQVALKPKYTGGDLENDLSNISVIRSDVVSKYVNPHDHLSDREGGPLDSHSIRFADDLARLTTGNVTDIIYKLLDLIENQNAQIQLLRAIEGVVRWDAGFFWDDPNLFWDSN